MKVRWSTLAFADLRAILEYLSSENPAAASRFVRRLDGVMRRISQVPDGAQAVAERPGVRRIPLVRYPYVVFYKVIGGEALILRVIHGARDRLWSQFGQD